MKFILFAISILIFSSTYSQVRNVNIDSIVNRCHSKFIKGEDVKYLSAYFKAYKSENNSEALHIYLDSSNMPAEYIGLCVLYYKFDSYQRVISIEGWNSKGEPSYWDFADLTTYEYIDYSNSKLIRKLQQIIPDFDAFDTTTFMLRITKEINKVPNNKYNQTDYEVESIDGKWTLRYYSKPNKGIRLVCDNAWFVLKHKDSTMRVDAEYFIGMDTILIDGKHECSGFYSSLAYSGNNEGNSPEYSYVIKYNNLEESGIKYYNSKNKLVATRILSSILAPIGGPVKSEKFR